MERPALAPGVALAGPMPGTAFKRPQWLVQRGDRYLQVSEILYRIAEAADGSRTCDEIAVLVAAATRVDLTGDDIRTMVETKLTPAGIVGDHPADVAHRDASPLAVRLGAALIGPRVIGPLTWVAQLFFIPGVAIVGIATSIAVRVWLYGTHGLAHPLEAVVYEPWRFAALGLIAVGAAAFHELGHATALRVVGGRARGMGVGLYLIYPVFYTDVTDSYRLGRWRRLLTDIGGFYFNLVFALGVLAAYVITREDWLLVAVALIDVEILHQTLPLGRLDGYWILADLTGVPDFFALAGPLARRAVGQGRGPALRPIANVVVALYLLLIIPALALMTYFVVRGAPRVVLATLDSWLRQAARFEDARAAQDLAAGAAAVGQGVILLLPLIAIALFLLTSARWLGRGFIAASGRTRRQRLAGALSAVAAGALLIALWNTGPTALAQGARAAVEQLVPATQEMIDPGTTSPPVTPAVNTPRAVPPTVQATSVPAAPTMRSTAPVKTTSAPTPTPVASPSKTSLPSPSATPSPTSPPSPSAGTMPSPTPSPAATR